MFFKYPNKQQITLKSITNVKIKIPFLEITGLLRSLVYWPVALGYQNTNGLSPWFLRQQSLKYLKKWQNKWKSELLLQVVSRNINLTLYTPKIFSIVDKVHLIGWVAWLNWNKENASIILYNITTGRCGFKPNETKSFIAGDTTIRAGLWLIYRNYKKLTPVKLHIAGIKSKITIYFNRIKLIHNFYSFNDATPIAFNGCRLLHLPRKRFRTHEYNVNKVALFTKSFQYRSFLIK